MAGSTRDGKIAMTKLESFLKEKKIDGSSDVGKAREAIKDSLSALQTWQGINRIRMRESGDGHIKAHLLRANLEGKTWEFALAPDQRIKEGAVIK